MVSRLKADAVRYHLMESENLSQVEFRVKGWGKTNPLTNNETDENRANNRRLEILIQSIH
jgi:flagellar motor protein MotB